MQTAFGASQPMHRALIGCVAGEMKSPQALDGHNCAVAQEGGGAGDVILPIPPRGCAILRFQPHPWTADWTRYWFGVEAAISGIPVFCRTGSAE
jgi:hypothetical protein